MKTRFSLLMICTAVLAAVIFYSCSKSMEASAVGSGKGGSLTRFTIAGNFLYVVDNHYLYAYDLANPVQPNKVYTSPLNFDIETIYPYNNNLFLGTKTGLYIYSISKPHQPELIGQASHARSCDPVVANDSVAFVTLKGSGNCGPAVSGLYIHDITTLTQPVLKKTVEMPNPAGLGLQDSVLYVSCGYSGLKVLNVKSPYNPLVLSTITDGNYVDVIPYNGILICFVQDGIILYDITNPAVPVLVKKITS